MEYRGKCLVKAWRARWASGHAAEYKIGVWVACKGGEAPSQWVVAEVGGNVVWAGVRPRHGHQLCLSSTPAGPWCDEAFAQRKLLPRGACLEYSRNRKGTALGDGEGGHVALNELIQRLHSSGSNTVEHFKNVSHDDAALLHAECGKKVAVVGEVVAKLDELVEWKALNNPLHVPVSPELPQALNNCGGGKELPYNCAR